MSAFKRRFLLHFFLMQKHEIFFPFETTRLFQDELIKDVLMALGGKKHLLCHAPTGLGKTASVLSPAISFALKENKNIFFLTPKTSQHQIAVELVKSMSKKFGLNISAIDLVGKKQMCSDPLLSNTDFEGFYEVCSKRVAKEKCHYYGNAVGYTKEQKDVSRLYIEHLSKASLPVLDHYDFKDLAVSMKGRNGERPMCAYEASMQVARQSNVIICDYFHLLNPKIGKLTLQRLGKRLSESIIIVDEAHNLPERLRKIMSSSITTFSVSRACEELKVIGEKELHQKCMHLKKCLKKIAIDTIKENTGEALVSMDAFVSLLQKEISSVEEFSAALRASAVDYLELANRSKSKLVSVANFLDKWVLEEKDFVRIAKKIRGETEFTLSIQCLDSSQIMSKVFNQSHCSILMSGTLLPTEMYADLSGLQKDRLVLREYKSPFPVENRLNLIVTGVTTKFSQRQDAEFRKIAQKVTEITNNTPGNCAVFFPSFALLSQISFFIESLTQKELIRQKQQMTSAEKALQLQNFKNAGKSTGAVLLAVANGSYAEGIDFPGSELLCAIVVGIPLPELDLYTKRLIDFFEEKFQRGWHYAYLYPSISRALQASGRVIRSEKDKGITVFMDERYDWKNYANCFPKDLNKVTTSEPAAYVKEFWGKTTNLNSF